MKSFLDLTIRYWIGISAIAVLTAVSTLVFGSYFNQNAYATTVFLNIGAKSNPQISPLDTVQAADSFTETVMGWFKNPDFIAKIADNAGYGTEPAARKQEKQNLVVTYKTQDQQQAEKVYQSIITGLQSEIGKYNSAADSGFVLTFSSKNTAESKIPLLLFGLAGIIFGLMLGFALTAAFDRITKELNEYRH
jgi:preprotein translocase subunit SecF